MEISNGNWPADVLIDILLKLPVKSIIRFKGVAKTWCHLFQNPTFVSQHLIIAKKMNKQYLVIYRGGGPNNKANMRLFGDEAHVSHHDLCQQLPSEFDSIFGFSFYVDNGLFCLFDTINDCITLWNPATREFRILPHFNQNPHPKIDSFCPILGFGFDPSSNDYKVIYIREYYGLEGLEGNGQGQVPTHYAVYSMKRDSWRVFKEEEVKLFQHHSVGDEHSNNACVNGVYYWHAFDNGNGIGFGPSVAALNLGTEVFQLIASPLHGLQRCGQLMPLRNRIAIWDTVANPDDEISHDIWVLNDEGQWTKVLKIKPVLEVYMMFGFWRNGKVLVVTFSGQLLLYDLETEEAKEVGFQSVEGGDLWVGTYEESLAAVK